MDGEKHSVKEIMNHDIPEHRAYLH